VATPATLLTAYPTSEDSRRNRRHAARSSATSVLRVSTLSGRKRDSARERVTGLEENFRSCFHAHGNSGSAPSFCGGKMTGSPFFFGCGAGSGSARPRRRGKDPRRGRKFRTRRGGDPFLYGGKGSPAPPRPAKARIFEQEGTEATEVRPRRSSPLRYLVASCAKLDSADSRLQAVGRDRFAGRDTVYGAKQQSRPKFGPVTRNGYRGSMLTEFFRSRQTAGRR
jgi:hypothetical protein